MRICGPQFLTRRNIDSNVVSYLEKPLIDETFTVSLQLDANKIVRQHRRDGSDIKS